MAKAPPPETGWAALTWDDLERWAGSRSVSRGRTYQRGGRVTDLRVSDEGELLATVQGTRRYATTVALRPGKKHPSPESTCTCPVGADGCKHAVAVVAAYLDAVANGQPVPAASPDDPRWAKLEDGPAAPDDDWEEGYGGYEDDEEWDDEGDEDEAPAPRAPAPRAASRRRPDPVNWDEKIEQSIRATSREELADLVWNLARRFPEVYQEFRERIALAEGDVDRLVEEARREVRKVTAEPGWQNHWDGGGYTPDYARVRHRLERLLELGHADEVVSLGRELIRAGLRQVGESHDEGETATAFAECLPAVFRAVTRSSLSGPERLLFAIDAELEDDYDAVGEAGGIVLDAPAEPADWSAVADALLRRLEKEPPRGDSFSRNYARDRITNWVATALEHAGRSEELLALYEAEARATDSYERLVSYLLERRRFEDAERWAREGIAATRERYPGIASHLAERLREVARGRRRWDVVAAHAAYQFFDRPGVSTFNELVKAAEKAGVGEPVKAAALRFLETGEAPFRVAPRPAPAAPARPRSPGRRRAVAATPPPPPPPAASPAERLKVDPGWPLPVPDDLVPLLDRRGAYDPGPRPHPEVLLELAMAAKRPDEVLRWFDRMRAGPRRPGEYTSWQAYADRVAEAVSAAYPERSIEIYRAALEAQLPHPNQSAYEAAAGYLRKLRPLYEGLGRGAEWAALLASIREKYRNRPRFMEALDTLEGRTILQSARKSRK